jgi:hypothetical protein
MRVLEEGHDTNYLSRPTFTHRLMSLTGLSLGPPFGTSESACRRNGFLARIVGLCFVRWH